MHGPGFWVTNDPPNLKRSELANGPLDIIGGINMPLKTPIVEEYWFISVASHGKCLRTTQVIYHLILTEHLAFVLTSTPAARRHNELRPDLFEKILLLASEAVPRVISWSW